MVIMCSNSTGLVPPISPNSLDEATARWRCATWASGLKLRCKSWDAARGCSRNPCRRRFVYSIGGDNMFERNLGVKHEKRALPVTSKTGYTDGYQYHSISISINFAVWDVDGYGWCSGLFEMIIPGDSYSMMFLEGWKHQAVFELGIFQDLDEGKSAGTQTSGENHGRYVRKKTIQCPKRRSNTLNTQKCWPIIGWPIIWEKWWHFSHFSGENDDQS